MALGKKISRIIILSALLAIFSLSLVLIPKANHQESSRNLVAGPQPSLTVSPTPVVPKNIIYYEFNSGASRKAFGQPVTAKSYTVFSLLEDLSKANNFGLKYNNNNKWGVFIESIEGIKNGTDGKYWQYYVNGKLGEVAADKQNIQAGDRVEWRYEKVNF